MKRGLTIKRTTNQGFTLKRTTNQGFTLIELMVTMALIAVMTAVGLANFRGSSRSQTVEGAAERLRQMFVQAKINSASGKKDCRICGAATGICGQGDQPLQGWEVRVDNSVSPVAVTVQGRCGPVPYPTPPLPTTFLTRTETLPQGVSVTMRFGALAITPTPVLFRPSSGGIVPEITSTSIFTFDITDAYGNISSFTLTGSGEVGEVL